jgi:hypothetical protein
LQHGCKFFSCANRWEKNCERCLFARNESGQATQFDCKDSRFAPVGKRHQGFISAMWFWRCRVENPFEKALQSSSFSRGIFVGFGSLVLEFKESITRRKVFTERARENRFLQKGVLS